MEDIAVYVREKEKIDEKNLFLIVDRREAIKKAFTLAKEHDIVLLAGKGAEQFIIENNAHIPWDDRMVARELLSEMGYSKNNDK
jgi:UDP-N-acetylmuramoyl-L-alanyl-D-glutamate--2,6-diaminopimelate ligase